MEGVAVREMAPDGENQPPECDPAGSTGENGLKM